MDENAGGTDYQEM